MFKDFLINNRKFVAKFPQIYKENKIHLILGNESCDLDSVVSATALAYYYATTDPLWLPIPICNTTRNQLELKTEVIYCYGKHGIDKSLLICVDDIKNVDFICDINHLRISLVDHNVPVGFGVGFKSIIYNIVDHHQVYNSTSCHGQAKISLVGSCSTLIAENILDLPFVDRDLTRIIYETILLDCGFKPDGSSANGTEEDLRILTKLESSLSLTADDRHKLTESLWRAKCDISNLTLSQILMKDMKEIKSSTINHISAVPMALSDFLKVDRLEHFIKLYSEINDLNFLIILPYSFAPSGFSRSIIVHNSFSTRREEFVLKLCQQSYLCLELVEECETLSVFKQNDSKYSRKQLLPIFRDIIDSI